MAPAAEPDPRTVIGVDLGGTKISVAQVEADGRRRGERSRRLHSNAGPDAVVEEILATIDLVRGNSTAPIEAVGVGAAAQVDEASGLVHHAPNLGWREYPLGAKLAEALGVPVAVLNDARAATIAEWRFGAGQRANDLLVVFVGTGVGGSVVAGGRLLEGASGAFGEVGHSILFAGGRKCHCPGRGCLEAYVGGWAIAQRAREAVAADPSGGAPLLVEADRVGDGLGAASVGRAAMLGVPLALRLVNETGDWLGQGVAGLVNAFNPARVVLGGGVIEGWPELVGDVDGAIRRHCQPPAANAVTVHPVALGHDAVLIGAATVARERTFNRR
ncbi:MAG: ROK family protein [Thermoplasmata archaeon]|nr:ROK family protein [Thermoplasmata archaeon]MCI4357239.1 ROK family protein [Thermoplasmata archaeon]